MIEKMLAVDVVCLAHERQQTLLHLRELAILHLKLVRPPDSNEVAQLRRTHEELAECMRTLSARRARSQREEFDYSEQTVTLQPSALAHRVHELIVTLGRLQEEQEHWRRTVEQLTPWGTFDPQLVTTLRQRGLQVAFCVYPPEQPPVLPPGCYLHPVTESGGRCHALAVSDQPLPDDLPVVAVPLQDDLPTARQRLAELQDRLDATERELDRHACFLSKVQQDYEHCTERIEFHQIQDAMGAADALAFLSGYIPAKHEADLRAAARQHGWAILLREPAEDDAEVPTLVTVPRWLNVSKPIFDFVGIAPGYHEFDISAWFLIFFAIFFALILGDAGYGVVFLLGTLATKYKLKGKFRVQTNLLLILSLATILWGSLTGTWFGIDQRVAFGRVLIPALPWFDPTTPGPDGQPQGSLVVNHHLQLVCFALAAVHLTVAHVWKVLLSINSLMALSQVGWALAVWANFCLATRLVAEYSIPSGFIVGLYIAAAVLIVLFTHPSRNPFKMVGLGLGAIAGGGVNSFVDVVSYIRLFAVGMSSYYVATSFNDIGMGLTHGSPWLIPLAVFVLFFGHALNIVLSMLGVLVHGIRLNTLEFSGHLGLEWKGIPFRPFARRLKEEIVQ